MFGSCCEEQEAQEAEYRARIRAATAQSEKRLFGRSLAAARAQSKRCTHLACEGDVCGIECFDCDEEEEDEAHASIEPSGDPRMAGDCDEDEEDEEEAELLRKLRATRLAQFRKEAEKKEAEKRVLGYEYTDERALLQLLNDAAAPFLVCLLGVPDEGELLSQWLDDHLTAVAPRHPAARFLRVQDCPALLDGLPSVRSVPALLLFERGVVIACEQGLGEEREPDRLQARIDRWLQAHASKLVAPKQSNQHSDDSDDEGEGEASYCGRAGCRAYPHEHVLWKDRNGNKAAR
eukprot:Transcript_11824.p1 GENE.Transcript_11824~~Transcript_11824.p1  ORF type:complete len:291 (-),score=106.58 Transcript_11824:121-993(-)